MKKTRLNPISDKHKVELGKRRLLHYKLWLKQEGKCKKCGQLRTFNQTELSHKKSLAQGGKTEAKNCAVLCASWLKGCHPNSKHNLRNKYNEQPDWSK